MARNTTSTGSGIWKNPDVDCDWLMYLAGALSLGHVDSVNPDR